MDELDSQLMAIVKLAHLKREAEKARVRNEETKKVPVEEWAEKLAGDLAKFKD